MRRAFPRGRRLHLIDVENLVTCPRPAASEVSACRRRYAELVKPACGDLCVVACNHGAGAEVGFSWPGARHLWRSGPDGADLALLEVLTGESVSDRFEAVVVASGDGRFADPVAWLARCGVRATVVANRGSLSRRLELAATAVVLFDVEPPPAMPAAVGVRGAA